jgi:hypothetical protein
VPPFGHYHGVGDHKESLTGCGTTTDGHGKAIARKERCALSDYLDGRRIGAVRSSMDQSVGIGLFSFTEKPDDTRIDER